MGSGKCVRSCPDLLNMLRSLEPWHSQNPEWFIEAPSPQRFRTRRLGCCRSQRPSRRSPSPTHSATSTPAITPDSLQSSAKSSWTTDTSTYFGQPQNQANQPPTNQPTNKVSSRFATICGKQLCSFGRENWS